MNESFSEKLRTLENITISIPEVKVKKMGNKDIRIKMPKINVDIFFTSI